MTRLAPIALLILGCNSNTLSAPVDMGAGGGCAAFRACYTQQPDASFTNCEPGFSALAIARAVELEDCKLIACLSDHGDAAARRCESATDQSAACVQCRDNAERGGPLGPCDPPHDPLCGACSAEVSVCYGS
jgi:hypothetical protein